jgi:chromosome segregation ATPase
MAKGKQARDARIATRRSSTLLDTAGWWQAEATRLRGMLQNSQQAVASKNVGAALLRGSLAQTNGQVQTLENANVHLAGQYDAVNAQLGEAQRQAGEALGAAIDVGNQLLISEYKAGKLQSQIGNLRDENKSLCQADQKKAQTLSHLKNVVTADKGLLVSNETLKGECDSQEKEMANTWEQLQAMAKKLAAVKTSESYLKGQKGYYKGKMAQLQEALAREENQARQAQNRSIPLQVDVDRLKYQQE